MLAGRNVCGHVEFVGLLDLEKAERRYKNHLQQAHDTDEQLDPSQLVPNLREEDQVRNEHAERKPGQDQGDPPQDLAVRLGCVGSPHQIGRHDRAGGNERHVHGFQHVCLLYLSAYSGNQPDADSQRNKTESVPTSGDDDVEREHDHHRDAHVAQVTPGREAREVDEEQIHLVQDAHRDQAAAEADSGEQPSESGPVIAEDACKRAEHPADEHRQKHQCQTHESPPLFSRPPPTDGRQNNSVHRCHHHEEQRHYQVPSQESSHDAQHEHARNGHHGQKKERHRALLSKFHTTRFLLFFKSIAP